MDYRDKVYKLASHLLKEAGDKFSNHGCSDLHYDFSDWTEEDYKQFCKDGEKWNKGDLELESMDHLEDWVAMKVCAHILSSLTEQTRH
jgi:hypothetical protein